MCLSPEMLGHIATGFQVAGAVSSAVGAYNKSKADRQALEYQAAVTANNAKLAEMRAQAEVARGQQAEATLRLKTAQLRGTQRAMLSARGVSLDEGSPLNILLDTDYMGEQDALTIRDNASARAWTERQSAKTLDYESELLRSRASQIKPMAAGAATLLAGAGQVAESWYRRREAGVKGS